MELFLVFLLIVVIIIDCWLSFLRLKVQRQIDARLRVIASLTRDTRSSQGSIGIRRVTGAVPIIDRPNQVGPRHDVPATGRMRTGLKFEQRGGEHERNRDTEGD